MAIQQMGTAAALWHFGLLAEVEVYGGRDNTLRGFTVPRTWRPKFEYRFPSNEELYVCAVAAEAAESRILGHEPKEILLDEDMATYFLTQIKGQDHKTLDDLINSKYFLDAQALMDRYKAEILSGAKTLVSEYKLDQRQVLRLFRRSLVVDGISQWLGVPGDGDCFPNVDRWVETSELHEEIKDHLESTYTRKRESDFRRAIWERVAALRVLGVQTKTVRGSWLLKFRPNPQQMDICKRVYFRGWCPMADLCEEEAWKRSQLMGK